MKSKNKVAIQPEPESPAALLSPSNPEDLRWEAQALQLAIARRAYELFETRGREHGHDQEDWFRSESELLRPVSVSMSESENGIRVQANVFGFEENELRVSVEPCRLTILGKKGMSATETEGGKLGYIDWYPDQILHVVELPTEVRPESAVVELQAGLLQFELRKAVDERAETEAPAA